MAQRTDFAIALAREAGALALRLFRDFDRHSIELKGVHDYVSNADRDVETLIRSKIAEQFPEDAIIGEEHGVSRGKSGFSWVIDPIDGTSNYVSGIPAWAVVIAGVEKDRTEFGVIFEPCSGELFVATRGGGATVNDRPLLVSAANAFSEGAIGTGFSGRAPAILTARAATMIVEEGGRYFRNASGALMLAYVAAGRLLGFIEASMNSWDCLAGMLMVEEAGGRVFDDGGSETLLKGKRAVAAGPGIYARLSEIAEEAFGPPGLPPAGEPRNGRPL